MRTERPFEGDMAGRANGIYLDTINLVRRHQANPGMVKVLFVPFEELTVKASGILDAGEALLESVAGTSASCRGFRRKGCRRMCADRYASR